MPAFRFPSFSLFRPSRWMTLSLLMLAAFTLGAARAHAATLTVTNLNASGTGSLSAAISQANTDNSDDTIVFQSGLSGTISAPPTITASMTIQGPNSGPGITISGGNVGPIFNIQSGKVTISDLTIVNAYTIAGGGGAYNFAGATLTVTNCTFSGNVAANSGSAIYNNGTLIVMNSTFSGNSTYSVGAAIYNDGTMTVTNSTFSGNSAPDSGRVGGAIFNASTGTATLTDSIFSGNSANSGDGGIYNNGGTITENHNLFYNNTGGDANFTLAATDITGKDPDLLPLLNYGGSTDTYLPRPGSPAICAGTATMPAGVTLPTTDQRGFPLKSACVDIGAVQTNYVKATSVSTSYSGMEDVDLTGRTGTQYATTTITSGAVNLIGPGADKLTLDASKVSNASVVTVNSGAQATLCGITLTGGTGHSVSVGGAGGAGGAGGSFIYGGGGIYNAGTLTVTDSTISGNTAPNVGGGIYNAGTMTVTNSTISGNTAISAGGGGVYNAGTLTVTNSTISGNTAPNGGQGGGMANAGTLTVTDSTISGNTANYGGGVYSAYSYTSSTVEFLNTTIAHNSATADGGGINSFYSNSAPILTNTIVSDNSAPNGPDIYGGYNNNGGNVVSSPTIYLAPLGNYGGPTQTMPPLSGSFALNAGTYQAGEPTTDQRGAPRPSTVGATIDSGSVQISDEPPLILSVTPHYGLTTGGPSVTITGTGLDGSTASNTMVDFGNGNPANSVTIQPTLLFASLMVTAPPASTGTVNVTVTNSYGTSATNSNDLFTYETPVTISPISTSSATYGTPYTETFTVSGGTGSYTLANSGTLPSGWTLTPSSAGWTLSGTATSTANTDFTLTATDNSLSANTTTQTYTIDVEKAPASVTLTSSTANANLNASVTFTAMVTSSTTGTPTGSVEFLDGSTVLGSGPLNSSGTATYSTSSLTAGMHQITAVYQGDADFTEATSAALAQMVTAPDFGLTTNTKSLSLKDGQTGTVMVSLDPVGGFKGTVQFSCSGLPANSSCTFSPASLTANGSNTAQTDQMTIATQGPNSGTVAMMTHPGKPDGIMMAGIFWLPGLLFGGFLFWQRKKLTHKYRILLILLVAAATISGAVGCGSTPIHTAPGSSLVTVTATSGSTSHTATVYLEVTK